jgi:hypothetical protein
MKWSKIAVTALAVAALIALALMVAPPAHAAGGKSSTPSRVPTCAVVSAVMLLLDGAYADVFCPDRVIRVSVGALQPAPSVGQASLVRTAGGLWYLTQAGEAWRVVGP